MAEWETDPSSLAELDTYCLSPKAAVLHDGGGENWLRPLQKAEHEWYGATAGHVLLTEWTVTSFILDKASEVVRKGGKNSFHSKLYPLGDLYRNVEIWSLGEYAFPLNSEESLSLLVIGRQGSQGVFLPPTWLSWRKPHLWLLCMLLSTL